MNWGGTRGRRVETIGLASTSSSTQFLTSNATSATEGAWTTLGQFSVPMNSFMVFLNTRSGCSTIAEASFDIALGDGSTTLASDLYIDQAGGRQGRLHPIFFPLVVPASVAVVMRLMTRTTTSWIGQASMMGMSGTPTELGGYRSLVPINVSAGIFTTVDPGGTANTKGAATSLTTGGLPDSYAGFYVELVSRKATSLAANTRYLCDIMTGTGPIASNLYFGANSGEDNFSIIQGPFFARLAEGSPITARLQCSNNTATLRTREVALHCFK